jgi:predicted nuclease of restriction endonuclease-like (RecB) superfamily
MRLDTEAARTYYLNEARTQGWSVRVLERNIRTSYFERILSSQKSVLPVVAQTNAIAPDDLIKDPYVLEFLGLPENPVPKETNLEQAIINHLQKFLLEMGRGFSFVGRQFRISTETTHFYIDLVFYNYSR